MSENRYFDKSGPLRLEHDSSPRDYPLRQGLADPPSYSQDFRYRGYPGNSFLSPRLRPGQQLIEEEKKISNSRKPSLFSPVEFHRRSVMADYRDNQVSEPESLKMPLYRSDLDKPQSASKIYVHQTRGMPLGERRTSAEIRKIQEQRVGVEKDIQYFKEEQRKKKLKELEEKKRDFEMLKGYDMMDKKFGGGAPKGDGDNRKRKFTEQDVTPRGELRYRDPMLPATLLTGSKLEKNNEGDFILDYLGRPGNGAPLVTESGEIKADMQGDPAIRYNDGGRAAIENRLRYRQSPSQNKTSSLEMHSKTSKQQSDETQGEQKQLEQQTARIRDLRQELDMIRKSEEFGKPIAEASQKPESESFAARTEESKSLDLERTRGGAGAPQLDETGRPKTRFPTTMHRNYYGVSKIDEVLPSHRRRMNADREDEDYYPFGRPGGGAPIVDEQGNPKVLLSSSISKPKSSADIRRKQLAARDLLKELNSEMVEQKRNRDDMENYFKQPDKDLADLINQGKVGYPRRNPETGALLPQHLASSDISKQKANHVDQTKVAQKKYHDELEVQANERRRIRELEKLKQKQEEVLHCDVFGGQFRKYGGGAPKGPYTQKKENLAQMLYTPRKEERVVAKAPWDSSENPQYRKVYEQDRLYPVGHFAKSTIRSTHANQFEIPAQPVKGDYRPPAPYATY